MSSIHANFYKTFLSNFSRYMIPWFRVSIKGTDGPYIIATSGQKAKQFPVIEGTGLRLEWFDVVVTGDEVDRKKPDPQIYLRTAERLGLSPSRCIVFEDAPAGVAAAKAAGMTCVAVTTSAPREQLQAADLIVESLAELDLLQLKALLAR